MELLLDSGATLEPELLECTVEHRRANTDTVRLLLEKGILEIRGCTEEAEIAATGAWETRKDSIVRLFEEYGISYGKYAQ